MNELQRMIDVFLEERGWKDRAEPVNYAKSICIESAELLELFQWSSPDRTQIKTNPELLSKVQGELADVLIYCLDMANILDLDVEEIIREKMRHNTEKYPASLMQSDESAYARRKTEYRSRKER